MNEHVGDASLSVGAPEAVHVLRALDNCGLHVPDGLGYHTDPADACALVAPRP